MIKTKYEVIRRTENVSVEADAEFEEDITYTFSNYNEIYSYFSRYKFVDFLEDFWDAYDCQVRCHSKYYIQILNDANCLFFGKFLVSSMDITVRGEEPSLLAIPSFDERGNPIREINSILRDRLSFSQVKVCVAMEIKFFLSNSLDPLEAIRESTVYEISEQIMGRPLTDYEMEQLDYLHDEGSGSEIEEEPSGFPHPVETPFTADKCCICLTEKPDIILVPCLHKSVCLQCEEKGRLKKCPTCRLTINRKIKI